MLHLIVFLVGVLPFCVGLVALALIRNDSSDSSDDPPPPPDPEPRRPVLPPTPRPRRIRTPNRALDRRAVGRRSVPAPALRRTRVR